MWPGRQNRGVDGNAPIKYDDVMPNGREGGQWGRENLHPRTGRNAGRTRNESSMFEPLHRDHAIETVILQLTGSGEMMEHERANLDEGYEKYWKATLPAVSRTPLVEIAMGPTPLVDGRPKLLAPTRYAEVMRTGKAAWWMEIAGPTITVGCAQYGGWKSVSGKACELFAGVGKTLGNAHPLAQIRSAELTYRDLFVWRGADDAYDPKLAVRETRIPVKARNSKEWHTGEGWVEDSDEGRILERFQIGAELRAEGNRASPIVEVVTTAIWGVGATGARLRLDRAFGNIHPVGGSDGNGRSVYDRLHERIHTLFGSLITEEIAGRIGLTQPGELT